MLEQIIDLSGDLMEPIRDDTELEDKQYIWESIKSHTFYAQQHIDEPLELDDDSITFSELVQEEHQTEENGMMPIVEDERIEIKEEGFLENSEGTYYTSEESETDTKHNELKFCSSPKLCVSDYSDYNFNHNINEERVNYSKECKMKTLNYDKVKGRTACSKMNNYKCHAGRKRLGHGDGPNQNRYIGNEINSSRSPELALQKWIRCDICNKAFAYACLLAQHKLVHLGIKKYQCEVCNKAFSQLGNLNVHLLIHSGIKKYQCNICNRAFTQSSNLNQHKLIHSGVKKFKCDVCNEAFAQTGTLKRHKLIHTGVKKYKCDVCNKAFTQSGTLHNHKLIHNEFKNYECQICRRAFSQPRLLKKHKSVHSGGVQKYQCDTCKKDFMISSAQANTTEIIN